MSAPGPPRFVAVGETVTLAPRGPDPDADYRWRLVDAPAESRVSVNDEPVIEVTPDAPGTYRFELDAPDDSHTQRVRAFPHCRTAVELELPFDDVPDEIEVVDAVSVVGSFNNQLVGRDRPRRDDDRFVLDVELPPGEHHYGFCFNDDLTQQVHDSVTIPGPGRPRCRLETEVVGDGGSENSGDATTTLLLTTAIPSSSRPTRRPLQTASTTTATSPSSSSSTTATQSPTRRSKPTTARFAFRSPSYPTEPESTRSPSASATRLPTPSTCAETILASPSTTRTSRRRGRNRQRCMRFSFAHLRARRCRRRSGRSNAGSSTSIRLRSMCSG